VTFSIDPQTIGYTDEQGRSIESRLLDQVRLLPGVVIRQLCGQKDSCGHWDEVHDHARRFKPVRTENSLNTSINELLWTTFDTMGIAYRRRPRVHGP